MISVVSTIRICHAPGPFTQTSLEMARLRLPNMELGFDDEGFFGIDVRRLIIGREIARGAFGVVHEAVLLEDVPTEEDGPDIGQSGIVLCFEYEWIPGCALRALDFCGVKSSQMLRTQTYVPLLSYFRRSAFSSR